jgi:hypothetical protein
MGWFAAAPLRSLFRNYPVLAVIGGSGNGKTTILEEMVLLFGYRDPLTLLGTTPHAVTGFGSSTNSIPVWFDEYRADSGRDDTRQALEQLIRDAWNGHASIKGGSNRDNVMELTSAPARAPIIISGEDSFSETSHLERMVIVNVPRDGRNREAMEALSEMNEQGVPVIYRQGMGHAYLSWLLDAMDAGMLPPPPDVHDRQAHAQAVARWGYDLFEMFVLHHDPEACLPGYDGSRVAADQKEAVTTSPIETAIEEALDVYDADNKPIVWEGDGYRYCRVPALVSWTKKNRPDIKLPGGSTAITAWIKDKYGAVEHNHKAYGRTLRWEL